MQSASKAETAAARQPLCIATRPFFCVCLDGVQLFWHHSYPPWPAPFAWPSHTHDNQRVLLPGGGCAVSRATAMWARDAGCEVPCVILSTSPFAVDFFSSSTLFPLVVFLTLRAYAFVPLVTQRASSVPFASAAAAAAVTASLSATLSAVSAARPVRILEKKRHERAIRNGVAPERCAAAVPPRAADGAVVGD